MSKGIFVRLGAITVFSFTSLAALATTGVINVTANRTLTENHQGTFILSASVTLDCNNKKITNGTQGNVCGVNNSRSCGVLIKNSNATVKNCKVEDFDTGIDVVGAIAPTVTNNQVSDNTVGIRFDGVSGMGKNVSGNTLTENTEEGFNIDNTTNLNFLNNHVQYNGRDGIDVGTSQTLVFKSNNVHDNTLNGLEFDNSSFIGIIKNTISHNGRTGNRSGISFDNTDFSRIACNSSNRNGRNGYRITTGSTNNIIEKNTATKNMEADAFEDTSSRPNTWTGNVFADQGQRGTPDCTNVN